MEDSTIQIYNVRVDEVNTVTFLLSSSWCKRFGYVDTQELPIIGDKLSMSCCFFYFWRQFEKIFVSLDGTAVPVSTCLHVWQVKSKLKGHQKRITGLAFSNALNVLVSSGADAQVLVFQSLSITSMYEDPVLQKIVLSSMEFWLHISLVPPGRMCLFSYFLLLHRCPRCFCQNEVSTVILLTQMM